MVDFTLMNFGNIFTLFLSVLKWIVLFSLFEIVQSLYWSTYGLIDLTNFNLEYPHSFTEFIGELVGL